MITIYDGENTLVGIMLAHGYKITLPDNMKPSEPLQFWLDNPKITYADFESLYAKMVLQRKRALDER